MKIINDLKIIKKYQRSVVAVGNFDGIHLGHRKVINQGRLKAKKENLAFGVITFEPLPVMFFNKNIKNHRINSLDQKKNELKKLNLDFLIIIKFNKFFSKLSAQDFIKKIIYEKIKCKFLYVSNNFRFGNKRKGNINTLKKYAKKFDYKIVITKPFKKKSKIISSTIIRRLISNGDISKTSNLLSRNWSICGRVVKGEKRGRKIGFPTCNLEIKDYVIPKLGVYSVDVKIKNFIKKGIANIGYRPTFKGKKLLLETNLFGFKGNLYNKYIEVNFKKFIRSEKKFKNLEFLKKQIKIDINQAR